MAAILVVDPDQKVRGGLWKVLTDGGHTVRTAETGIECFRLAVIEQPDLVIIGWDVSGLTGVQTVRSLRIAGVQTRAVLYCEHSERISTLVDTRGFTVVDKSRPFSDLLDEVGRVLAEDPA